MIYTSPDYLLKYSDVLSEVIALAKLDKYADDFIELRSRIVKSFILLRIATSLRSLFPQQWLFIAQFSLIVVALTTIFLYSPHSIGLEKCTCFFSLSID